MEKNRIPVLVDAVRSPIGLKKTPLLALRPDELGSLLIKALLDRNQALEPARICDVLVGCAFPEGVQGMLVARAISTLAGLPVSTTAAVVNRFCGSSMEATHQICRMIETGDADVGVAGGVEDMLRVPMGGFNPGFQRDLHRINYYVGMGETAENLAKKLNISRSDQETFSVRSHEKALEAVTQGRFDKEVVSITLGDTSMEKDEGPRQPDLAKMQALTPAFNEKGSVTPATSSPLSFGASMLLITSEQFAIDHGLPIRAEFVSRGLAGVPWETMGEGPLPATRQALTRANLSMDDMEAIELNEAFAAQALYVIRTGDWNEDRININGGALALGHPLGASGARILTTLLNVLEQRDLSTGLATMCIGSGQGISTIIRRRS